MHYKMNFIHDAIRCVPNKNRKIKFEGSIEICWTQFSLWYAIIRIVKFSKYCLHSLKEKGKTAFFSAIGMKDNFYGMVCTTIST